jgi:hypothetical protein
LPRVTTRGRFRLFARQEACARILSGMLSAPMSPIFGLMTRFIRTLGDTRSEPLNTATKTLVTAISSCLKPACAGSSARNLPRGPLVLI